MVRYTPEGIGTKLFGISDEQNTKFWTDLIVNNLGTPRIEAQRALKRIRSRPVDSTLTSGETSKPIIPAYESAARLLTALSTAKELDGKKYRTVFDVNGPRGQRPILASAASISSVLGGTTEGHAATTLGKITKTYGGIDEFLVSLDLTASDVESWQSRSLEYSHEDVRRGLFLPETPDMQTARALGVIEADGHVAFNDDPYTRRLYLWADPRDTEPYSTTVPRIIEDAFNLLQDEPYETNRTSQKTGREYNVPELRYSSKGLVAFLREIKFPSNQAEINKFGFDSFVQKFDDTEMEEFLRAFVPFASGFSPANGSVTMYHPSRKRAKELQELMSDFLELPDAVTLNQHNVTNSETSNSFSLKLSRAPMRELYKRGFFELNPRLERDIGNYIETRYGLPVPSR